MRKTADEFAPNTLSGGVCNDEGRDTTSAPLRAALPHAQKTHRQTLKPLTTLMGAAAPL